MKSYLILSTALISFFVIYQKMAIAQSSQIAEIARLVTVQVNPPEGYASGGGTGVIISKEGNIYTVLTNHHVACLEPANINSCVTAGTIRTYLGKSYPVIKGSVVSLQKVPNDPDLAVVKFSAQDDYAVATIGKSARLSPLTEIFIYGFPALEGKIKEQRDGVFSKGGIVGFSSNPVAGYALKYNITTWWGQSGSPLFDLNGRVIGIHGRAVTSNNPLENKETQTGINSGIPIDMFVAAWQKIGGSLLSIDTGRVRPPESDVVVRQPQVKSTPTQIDVVCVTYPRC